MTRAAEILRISQPSLSQQLRNFEAEVGEALFIRQGRSIDLSPRGKQLYEHSKELFEIAEAITDSLSARSTEQTALFRIGVSAEIERPFVAEIVGKLLRTKKAQKTRFVIISKTHKEIAADLIAHRLDLAISNLPIREKKAIHEFDFPVFLTTSQSQGKFRHFQDENLPAIFQSLGEGLIAPSSELLLRQELDRFLARLTYSPPIVFESNILACTVRAIRENVGCGFLPLPYFLDEYKRGSISIIGPKKGFWQHRVLFYASPKGDQALVRNLIQVATDYINP